LSHQSNHIVLGSVVVIGYLLVLMFTVERAGTYIGLGVYGLLVALGIILGTLARQRNRLRLLFVALVNTSRFLVVYSAVTVILNVLNLITLPLANLGFSFFSLPFGSYASLYFVYAFGFNNRTHRYIFDWVDDRRVTLKS